MSMTIFVFVSVLRTVATGVSASNTLCPIELTNESYNDCVRLWQQDHNFQDSSTQSIRNALD
jgi:hypothetical protein